MERSVETPQRLSVLGSLHPASTYYTKLADQLDSKRGFQARPTVQSLPCLDRLVQGRKSTSCVVRTVRGSGWVRASKGRTHLLLQAVLTTLPNSKTTSPQKTLLAQFAYHGAMHKRKLGKHGFEMGALGLGCMGMSEFYGPANEEESVATIHLALDLGVTHFDTADVYGPFTNEEQIGRASC